MKRGFLTVKKIISLCLVLVVCLIGIGQAQPQRISVEAKTLSQLQSEQDALNKKIKDAQQKKKNAAAAISKIKSDKIKEEANQNLIEEQITTTEGIITDLDSKIEILEQQISDTEALLVIQEAAIVQGVEDFKLRLRAMYLSGNDSMASILLGSTDFFDMLMKLELIQRVAEFDNATIDSLIQMKNEYEATKLDYETQKADVETSRAEYAENKAYLDGLYSQSEQMLQYLAADEQKQKNISAEAIKAEEEAEKQIAKIITEMRNLEEGFVGGVFAWPVPGFTYITSGYGQRWGRLHKGIDIASSGIHNANIVAANSGRVIYASNSYIPGYSYGRYVMVDHGGGYVTLYGHCEKVIVSVGQTVTRGQTIATVGTTGNSTGYHLHFEIRVNGVANNPMKWLK